MSSFKYKALQPNGKLLEQSIQARDKNEVATLLKSKGLKVVSIQKNTNDIQLFQGRVSTVDKANFCRYMAVMIRSGLSIAESIEVIQAETENPKLKQILQDLSFSLQEGGDMSATLQKYPEVFDNVFLALLKAGEQSGSLEKTFDYLSQQLYAVHRLNKKIQAAMMYPSVIIVAMGGVGILMMTFVLPRLSSVFLKMKIPLPLPTKILLEFGQFMGKNTLPVLGGVVVVVAFLFFLFNYHKTRRFITSHLANMPLVRRVFKQIDLARFSRTLATLLQSGVPIIMALNIASETLSQFDMKKVATTFEKGVGEGKTIASLLTTDKKVFPSLLVQTIRTGEKTGTLDSVLLEVSDYYEAELEDALKEFTTILEPVIMLVIGVAVGAMVVMIIAPIYSVLGGVQNMIK